MDRRFFISGISAAGSLLAMPALIGRAAAQQPPAAAPPAAPPPPPPFALKPLGYAYEALEPHIDTMTMRVHHSAHHQAFINGLNGLAGQWADLAKLDTVQILSDLNQVPENIRGPVRNNLGGHWNHSFFWDIMTPGGAKGPTGDLKAAIEGSFGSISNMVQALNQAGMGRFGSGWAWLGVDKDKKLTIFNTEYQNTPHMNNALGAVLGVDVWEHAYYLKHQNRRADYLRSWWNVVNWDKAMANFKSLTA